MRCLCGPCTTTWAQIVVRRGMRAVALPWNSVRIPTWPVTVAAAGGRHHVGIAASERFADDPGAELLQGGDLDPVGGIFRQDVADEGLPDFPVIVYAPSTRPTQLIVRHRMSS